MYRHLLIAATYENDKAVPSSQITAIVREGLESFDVDLERITSYQMPYAVNPMAAGLKDIWMGMSDPARVKLASLFPELAQAITLMLGVDDVTAATPAASH